MWVLTTYRYGYIKEYIGNIWLISYSKWGNYKVVILVCINSGIEAPKYY